MTNTLDLILHHVSKETGAPVAEIKKCQKSKVRKVNARYIFLRIAVDYTLSSQSAIGRYLGISAAMATINLRDSYKHEYIDKLCDEIKASFKLAYPDFKPEPKPKKTRERKVIVRVEPEPEYVQVVHHKPYYSNPNWMEHYFQKYAV